MIHNNHSFKFGIKLLFALCFGLMSFSFTTFAYNPGDVIGTAKYSAINTYINNYPISAYNVDGRQVICAEDLRAYGFDVTWDNNTRSLYIKPNYSTTSMVGQGTVYSQYYTASKKYDDIYYTDIKVYLMGNEIESFNISGSTMIKIRDLEVLGSVEYSFEGNYSKVTVTGLPETTYEPEPIDYDTKIIVVLDPGHGKSSGSMSYDEKVSDGYVQNGSSWGEWRHWKSGTADEECYGSGCNGNHSCWYSIGSGDRDKEPEINLRNSLAAKNYLENELGYEVRMTRTSNDQNPSFTKRVSYCYPNNELSATPDASCYVCIHANAGGGKGSAYISADSYYDQKWINGAYAYNSNKLGGLINDRIVTETSLSKLGDGSIDNEGWLILFNKSPIPAGYLEIGFYDSYDLNIVNSEYDAIGKAIAYGINDYFCD